MATTQEPLLAWHGDAKLQEDAVATMVAHRKADMLVKGWYWEGGKGCAVGCLIHSGEHFQYEPRFGIPQALARLEDTIFEHLPNGDALKWPERFLKAAKPGTDLSLVQWKFLAFVVDEALSRPEADSARAACQPALEIVRARARGEPVTESAAARRAIWAALAAARLAQAARSAWSAEAAAQAAWSAAQAAARLAWSAEAAAQAARSAELAAARLAWSAEAAAQAARSAALAAARLAAEARSAAWKRYADKLIELMKEAA